MANFKTTEEHVVLISRISEALRELQPGEAIPWDRLPFVPRKSRAAWVRRAAKACSIPIDLDRTGVLRLNPKDTTAGRPARKHAAGLRNKAKRTQRAFEKMAGFLDADAPASLHLEAAQGAGLAGSVYGLTNSQPMKVLGNARPKLPLFTGDGKRGKV